MPAACWHIFYGRMREVKKGEGMKLAIIYPDQEGWTVDRFRESAEERGIEVQTIAVTDELIARQDVDRRVSEADAVLWKFADATLAGFLASYPIMKNKPFINTGVALMPSATDKFLQQQLLVRSSLREYALPTYRVYNREHTQSLIEDGVMSYPIVIKPAWGTNAQNVHIIASSDELKKVDTWHSQIAEPFISSTEEWRVFVIGGAVAGIMKKHRREGANPDTTIIGGGARNVAEEDGHLSGRLADIAERVASLFHLEYAGIDIVRERSTQKLYVYEANSAAGWQNGFVEATGEDVPGQVLDWFEERLSLHRDSDVSRSVRKYLYRRSYRLPLLDELLLISVLMEVYPKSGMILRRQRLMGEVYEHLRRAVRYVVDEDGARGISHAREVLDNVGRHHTVDPRKMLGDALYEAVFGDENDMGPPAAEIAVDNLAEWVHYFKRQDDLSLVSTIDQVIKENFMAVSLLTLLTFAVSAREMGHPSEVESLIISRARASVSWAGNFLIDEQEQAVGISARHTLRQGYLQSAYYVQLEALVEKTGLQK